MGAAPRIPPRLARRLDQLALAAHRFHRFAHHPLCAEYEHEVLRFGRKTRICKGCAFAALGAAVGAASGWFAPLLLSGQRAALALGFGSTLTAAFLAHLGHRPHRFPVEGTGDSGALTRSHAMPPPRGKLGTRFLPSLFYAFTFIQGLRIGGCLGWLCLIASALGPGLIFIAYRRRGPSRGPCLTCPERFQMHRCRGVREILGRERAFQRLSGRMIHKGMAQ